MQQREVPSLIASSACFCLPQESETQTLVQIVVLKVIRQRVLHKLSMNQLGVVLIVEVVIIMLSLSETPL